MKKVLVTGATGGMGAAICKLLVKEGYKVYGIDYRECQKIDGIQFYDCDVTDTDAIEDVFEKYYNSGVFKRGIEYLMKGKQSAFEFFKELWLFYSEKGYNIVGQSRNSLYEILCEFEGNKSGVFRDLLKMDYLENNKSASSPVWSLIPYDKNLLKLRFEILTEDFIGKNLPEYMGMPLKETVKHLHFEKFCYKNEEANEHIVIFDRKYNRTVFVC